MFHALRRVAVPGLMVASLAVSGCAGVARGIDTSVYAQRGSAETFARPVPEGAALVVIRYPAMIHAHAEPIYISSFAVNAIGGEVSYAVYGKTQTSRLAQSVIAKSSYFAMSLYRELRQALPPESVLLSPHIVVWDEERGLHSRPILAAEQIPTVLTVDFNVYSYPDATEMMEAPPVTFGDLVTPLVVIRANRWVRPSLNGLLISSEPLAGSAWRQAGAFSSAALDARLFGGRVADEAPLAFIAYLQERDAPSPAVPLSRARAGRADRVAVEAYPLEKIRMDGLLLANLEEDYSVDPFAVSFVRGVSTRIVGLLNEVDIDRATFLDRQAALARFDPELGNVFFLLSSEESVRARLQLAEALIGAERRFLAAQSDSVYQGTYSGSYGAKMRKIIEAEYRMLEERRRLARVQNMTAAVATIALAGSVYGATVSTTASAATVASLSGLSLVGSVWVMNRSLDARAESEEVNEYFIARMAPAFERQMSVQMEWLESKELITARGFAEFRNKTLSLYQARVRSMTVSADRQCVFLHPTLDAVGRWYGRCREGLAEGRGYGVARNARGARVEFIGETEAGLASGTGAMIIHPGNPEGPTYYEGSFEDGQPDGVVLVEAPGEAGRLRRFSAGRDVGRGDAGRLEKLTFAPEWARSGALNP